jgi:hypothetical protein
MYVPYQIPLEITNATRELVNLKEQFRIEPIIIFKYLKKVTLQSS